MNITFESVITFIISLCVISVFAAIFIDFKLYDNKDETIRSKKSIVATGSMVCFFVMYYITMRMRLGSIHVESDTVYYFVLSVGAAMVAVGAAMNIWGRLNLKDNWSNHIKIYNTHALVTKGMYRFVRHPLYSSIMLMLFGGSLVYRNWLSVVFIAFIFVPFMYYRAKQEETLLMNQFKEYAEYREKVGMFFPKIGGKI